MKKNNKIRLVKILVAVLIVVVIGICIWKMWPILKELSNREGQIEFKEKIKSLGFRGLLLLFGLQILQILIVILPGEPFEVVAGMCYGTLGGALFITISVFITTTIVFFTVKKLGKKYLYNFFKKEKVDKMMKSKLLSSEKNLEIILSILFVLPASPKDLLVYIGGLLPVKPTRFILISTFVRLPSVITSTMVGANITNGNWKTSILIYLITFVITGVLIYFLNLRDKNKEIINMMKS